MKIGNTTVATVNGQKRRNADIFKRSLGYELDYDNPKTFNEKLNWLKFNYRDPLMTECSGKDTVREYVRRTCGSQYLTNLVGEGIYDTPEDIDFSTLPEQFVLKVSNGSGKNIICPDKNSLDTTASIDKLRSWTLKEANHYMNYYEWGYKKSLPRIVCEEFLGDMGSIRDYKLFCFYGEPKFIYASNEFDDHKRRIDMDYLTLDWERIGYVRKSYKPPSSMFNRPEYLTDMIDVARKLAKPFPFVRVDFFEVNTGPKVVEMTFYPSAGYGAFEDLNHDYEIGEMLPLPCKKNPAKLIDIM